MADSLPDIARQRDLLEATADAIDEGRDPFSAEWLSEHGLTLDESMSVGGAISVILRGYLSAPDEIQQEVLMRGSAATAGTQQIGIDLALDRIKAAGALKGIRNHGRAAGGGGSPEGPLG